MAHEVLIADDSPAIRAVISDALEDFGVPEDHIHTVEDGEKAVVTFEEVEPDVVFMDLNMPRVNGYEATETILRENPRARVVAVTGLGQDKQIVEDIRSVGAFDVLQKPIRFQDIKSVLMKIEEEHRGASRIQ